MVKAKFARNEIVLAKQKTLLYPAKIIKVDDNKKPVQYFVHYDGWNKKWDEWVPENNIMKHDKKGLAMQLEMKAAMEALENKPKGEMSSRKPKRALAVANAETQAAPKKSKKNAAPDPATLSPGPPLPPLIPIPLSELNEIRGERTGRAVVVAVEAATSSTIKHQVVGLDLGSCNCSICVSLGERMPDGELIMHDIGKLLDTNKQHFTSEMEPLARYS